MYKPSLNLQSHEHLFGELAIRSEMPLSELPSGLFETKTIFSCLSLSSVICGPFTYMD